MYQQPRRVDYRVNLLIRVRLHTCIGHCLQRADHIVCKGQTRVVHASKVRYVTGTPGPGRYWQCASSGGSPTMRSTQAQSTLGTQRCERQRTLPMCPEGLPGLAFGHRQVRFFKAVHLHIDCACTGTFCSSVCHQQRNVLFAVPHLPACQYPDEVTHIHACHLQCRGWLLHAKALSKQ